MSHTKGPWKLVKNTHGWFLKTKDGCVLGGVNRFITKPEECEANASLITVSPELLKSCKHTVRFWLEHRYKFRLSKNDVTNEAASFLIEQMDMYIAQMERVIVQAEGTP